VSGPCPLLLGNIRTQECPFKRTPSTPTHLVCFPDFLGSELILSNVDLTAAAVVGVGAGCAWIRWLRVSQREHYLAGAASRFSWRWWTSSARSVLFIALGIVAIPLSLLFAPLAAIVGVVIAIGPPGLGLRGRTAALTWTRRLRTLAFLSALALLAAMTGSAYGPHPLTILAVLAVGVPLFVDASAWILDPVEARLSRRWVAPASRTLRRVSPKIVAITGSYGKTSTKHHLAELLGGTTTVVPTPRSFNNRAGLARAVNEHLVDGTKVFIAEMGTYGPGEIRDMCSWCHPDVAVLTAIGPVHLERFGTIEAIVRAKAEITEGVRSVVCNVDDERLDTLAVQLRAAGREVLTAGSARQDADVRVEVVAERWRVVVLGETVLVTSPIPGIQPTNLACALAAAVALGYPTSELVPRIPSIAPVANRLTVASAPSGVLVVDDTYNSNPAGAGAALELLRSLPVDGRRVVVTPGMVELGARQRTENEAFAGAAASTAATVVVVGRTNLSALLCGASSAGAQVVRVPTRERAVEWVRSHLGHGDAVLYENDLPDHYP
jgi:UDP-N-acetylmuramoyl-tripeptide--D-alanyl-D-alanine ligase